MSSMRLMRLMAKFNRRVADKMIGVVAPYLGGRCSFTERVIKPLGRVWMSVAWRRRQPLAILRSQWERYDGT